MPDYRTQFGFDRKRIDQRLAFLYLSQADRAWAQRLHNEVIAPNVDTIVARFYETLLFQPESRRMLLSGETIERLKITQRKYLLTLGLDFDGEDYFEERLRIGVTHAAIGLPLHVYQCAYATLIRFIGQAFPDTITDNTKDHTALMHFLIKITALDMSLAIETYHGSNMTTMKHAVEELHTRERRLRKKAETDSLTGLFNRESAFDQMAKAIVDARQLSAALCVLMVDLDHFKKVNDTHGHQVGDEVLRTAASCITTAVRAHDIVGRYGGEEFIVGLINADVETAVTVAERIRRQIAQTPTKVNDNTIHITASIGLTHLHGDDNMQSLVRRADMALYAAKGAGRDCVIVG